jgi:hypothetical protein
MFEMFEMFEMFAPRLRSGTGTAFIIKFDPSPCPRVPERSRRVIFFEATRVPERSRGAKSVARSGPRAKWYPERSRWPEGH